MNVSIPTASIGHALVLYLGADDKLHLCGAGPLAFAAIELFRAHRGTVVDPLREMLRTEDAKMVDTLLEEIV